MDESTQSGHANRSKHVSELALNQLEKLGTQIDGVRFWFTRAWKIGLLMAKGGYLLQERRNLFKRLGEETYYRIQKGDLSLNELIPLTEEIKSISRKVELEELIIRKLRCGTYFRGRSSSPDQEEVQEPTNGD